ncbi:HAMP domain-containing histidine kinase [Clostridium sp. MSJ-11]|uniref:histidine kinase n=1 Tax=Clostridium mobile TaxID=2841512 RepID=A0ABS6EK33_9CLOT|nr:HAMP domain-containing sensor histidine kinase [Clostridium mobile]MBU5485573.1 HAMP domain-containing histidine kinase [Clostridium mobile]
MYMVDKIESEKDVLYNSYSNTVSIDDIINANLDGLENIKAEFFTNIVHELRTPVNIILGAIQLLNMDINDEINLSKLKKKDYYNSIKQNSFRLIKMINDILDLSKIESGYYNLNFGNYNIISIVEDIVSSVANYIEDQSICLIFDTNVEEKIIACDPEKIERIMLNLISNSVKFTKPGGLVEVIIKDRKDSVIVIVRDTGCGIQKDDLKDIFNRFTQVGKPSSKGMDGSGIGLSLVKSLVELHKGTIKAKSVYGKGTVMIIELPVIKTENSRNFTPCNKNLNKDITERLNIEFSYNTK